MTKSPQYTAYPLGSLTLDLEQDALPGTDGAAMPLRPKSLALLRLLVENAAKRMSCALRFIDGLQKASTLRICRTRGYFSPNWSSCPMSLIENNAGGFWI
jgi:hypothetical protein